MHQTVPPPMASTAAAEAIDAAAAVNGLMTPATASTAGQGMVLARHSVIPPMVSSFHFAVVPDLHDVGLFPPDYSQRLSQ